ncbi:MAG TPA: M50 family metallopeptidase [Chloroflexota bacterium]|nr:M50 family metallopeptidase [Chloroflexota bacterium]
MSWAYYLWIIPVLLLLVLAHEFGHYITARIFGVRVKEFAFGFPPRLAAVRIGDTDYALNAIPLGGYVRMEGEDGEIHSPNSFAAKARWQRAIILCAGAAMNVIIVPLLLTVVALVGEPTMDGIVIQQVQSGSPAEAAGIRVNDVVLRANGVPLSSETQFEQIINASLGKALVLTVSPTVDITHTQQVVVTPRIQVQAGQGHVGIAYMPRVVPVRSPVWKAPLVGVQQSVSFIGAFFDGIRQMFGSAGVQLSGPVGITKLTGEAAHAGPGPLIELTALLSINLAIINMLPFPALDGGRLAVVALERVRGRRLDPRLEGTIHFVGFMLLITLMLVISFHEVAAPQ